MVNQILEKIHNKTVKVGVVGMGYVGLPLAVEFAKVGVEVIGFDNNPEKMEQLNAGISYIQDVPTEEMRSLVEQGTLKGTTDFRLLQEVDAISICVPTPLGKTMEPDVSYILNATDNVTANLKKGHMVVLESTTYPGTTEELLQPILEKSGLKVGEDIFLAFSPERVDPGNEKYQTKNTPKVLGGVTPKCIEVIKALYELCIDTVVPVSSPRAAELTKLLENTFRKINIALVNEMAVISHHLDIDIWEVIDAAATKPFGFMPFYPGPGLGGHCIPIDPHYLSWKMRHYNYNPKFIELASEFNHSMPRFVLELIIDALNSVGKAVKGSRVCILGVAYKRDIDDMRETPAIPIMQLLEKKGAEVYFYDPYVASMDFGGRKLHSEDINDGSLYQRMDCFVCITNHSQVDYQNILDHCQLFVDTRNVTRDCNYEKSKVFKL